jgi:hypothetical protein
MDVGPWAFDFALARTGFAQKVAEVLGALLRCFSLFLWGRVGVGVLGAVQQIPSYPFGGAETLLGGNTQ